MTILPVNTAKQFVAAYERFGSIKAVARATGQSWRQVHKLYVAALAEGLMAGLKPGRKNRDHVTDVIKGKAKVPKPVVGGQKRATKAKPIERPSAGVSRYLFTCAQNNTKLHEPLWENLLKLKEFYNAELHISRFAYIQNGLGARGNKSTYFANVQSGKHDKDFWFDPRIDPFVSDDRRQVAPGLVWCGEANILPTAARPLSGLETFTGRSSGIFPHVKIAMESVASAKHDPVKFNYTTGTVTMRNYIQRKEGLKAEFHHCYGVLLVEVDNETGDWWCRQLNADSEGTLYDIDICVSHGVVTTTNKDLKIPGATFVYDRFVENIKWGDIHVHHMDPRVRKACWGEGGMLDHLKPKSQCLDDTLDFYARNHHELDDPVRMYQRFASHDDDVEAETREAVHFIDEARRPWCETVVVNSNHDRAMMRWLKNKNALYDSTNVRFWSQMNNLLYNTVWKTGEAPVMFEQAYLVLKGSKGLPNGLRFLRQDESFIICPAAGGIECGQHGDDGVNGSRGSTRSFARIGRKMNKGHDHTAAIVDSVYSGGCCMNMEDLPDWVHGPSSWSNSHTITYKNAKRAIITQWGPERKPWADR